MVEVNAHFTINSSFEKITFSALNEIENKEIAAALTDKLLNWEMRIKEAAVRNILVNEVGKDRARNIKVKLTKEIK